jgi:hypothetical protein
MNDSSGLTLAERQYLRLATNREAQLERMVREAEGMPQMSARLTEIRAAKRTIGEPVSGYLNYVVGSVLQAISSLRREDHWHDVSRVCFGQIDERDFAATTTLFEDGSSLVQISDTLVSLLAHLAATIVAVSGFNIGDQSALSLRRGDRSARRLPWAVAVATLRFHLLQMRVFGLPGKCAVLLTDRQQTQADRLSAAALHFVVAHEAAHHVLGHMRKGAGPDQPPVIDYSEDTELVADLFALRVQQVQLPQVFGRPSPVQALASSLLAIIAIELMEQGLFVRCAHTHPSSEIRRRALCGRVPAGDADIAQRELTPLIDACACAQRVRKALPQEYWEDFKVDPGVLREHRTDEYLQITSGLDRFTAGSIEKLLTFLERCRDADGVDLVDGLRERSTGGASAVLHRWGLPSARVDTIVDSAQALTFYDLHYYIGKSPLLRVETIGNTARTMVAMAAARILEPYLEST